MNFSKTPKPVDWKKILVVAIVLGIAGYQWYVQNVAVKSEAETVARDSGGNDAKDAPELITGTGTGGDKKPKANKTPSNTTANQKIAGTISDNQSTLPKAAASRNNGAATKAVTEQPVVTESKEFLESIGGKNLRSPAGLIYGMGGGGEHRVDHVMKHGVDDPDRPSHGVFDGDKATILKLLDEAYEMVKSKSKSVKSESSQGNTAYTISMGRKIGYEGGEKGNRSGNRGLNSVRLVLDGERVITAYPYR